jgi:hypothetical protein
LFRVPVCSPRGAVSPRSTEYELRLTPPPLGTVYGGKSSGLTSTTALNEFALPPPKKRGPPMVRAAARWDNFRPESLPVKNIDQSEDYRLHHVEWLKRERGKRKGRVESDLTSIRADSDQMDASSQRKRGPRACPCLEQGQAAERLAPGPPLARGRRISGQPDQIMH